MSISAAQEAALSQAARRMEEQLARASIPFTAVRIQGTASAGQTAPAKPQINIEVRLQDPTPEQMEEARQIARNNGLGERMHPDPDETPVHRVIDIRVLHA